MSKIKESDFLFAVARLKAIENKLLDKARLDRMLDTFTADDAIKMIQEADYGYSSSETADAYAYEKLLDEEMQKTVRLLDSISPHKSLFDVFMQKNDYHNVKVLLKAEFSGFENDDILMETGMIEVKKIKLILKERKFGDLPLIMRNAIEEVLDTYGRTGDPQCIDLILDRACFTQMLATAEQIGNSFLTGLIKTIIDTVNIKVFIRIKALKRSWDFAQKVLLKGGTLDVGVYVKELDASLESVVEAFKYTVYGTIFEKGIEDYIHTGNLALTEKLCDNHIMNTVKTVKRAIMGMEPLIAYYIAKETEIRNVRIVMTGKINQIPNDLIRERLRELYV